MASAVALYRCACSAPAPPLAGTFWDTGLDREDYLERIEFGSDGSGRMVQGDHQVIRLNVRFRYRVVDDGALEIAYGEGGDDAAPRRLGYRVDEGRHTFVQPLPGGGSATIVCRASVEFSAPPFPEGGPESRTYFGACRRQ